MHRIRVAMDADTKQSALLFGIVEADETYVGGKPRKGNRRDDDTPNKRGRGTKKTPVIGLMERGGRVVAKVAQAKELSAKGLARFIARFVDVDASLLITDEYRGYMGMSKLVKHATINHSVSYSEGLIHTNSIEGFWALVKRAWYGQHHHYSKKYMQLYVSEACFKHNVRKNKDDFGYALAVMVGA